MKTSYRKIEQKVINYRHYKSFSKEKFREPLNENLRRVIIEKLCNNFRNFINACNTVLDKQFPQKKKYIRGNKSPFMNKTLSEAIMLSVKLKSNFLKNRTNENKTNYVKKRNLCVSLPRKRKREYYSNLDQ